MKRDSPRVLTAFVVVSLALMAVPAISWADNSWGNYHWERASNPLELNLGDNLTSNWDDFLDTASSDWNLSAVLNTTIVPGGTRAKKCRPTKGQAEICNEAYGFNGWLGVAQIWVSGGHITQGTVKNNDSYFNTLTYNTPAWKHLVMCQEVGHLFGLQHQDEDFGNVPLGTCMDYSSDPAPNQHPNQHDYDQLEDIYTHFDEPEEESGGPPRGRGRNKMPPAMKDMEFDGPPQWGKLLQRGHHGHTELYMLDFGHGHKVFTFVVWAEPRGRSLKP
ncbi:MAG: hypothetical protein IH977_10855 [Nitrospinae bacterium]|nr:hypothetical protein [Nitrospinota bacterium]